MISNAAQNAAMQRRRAMRKPPVFPLGGQGSAEPAGYQGLGNIINILSQGINSDQYQHMAQGYTGANGAIGGMHGAFQGLSPYAVHFLASSGLLEQQQPNQIDTTGLTGDDLWKAQMQNSVSGMAPASYKLHSGVDENFLSQLLSGIPQGAYAKGFNAEGPTGGQGGFLPPRTVFPPGGMHGPRPHPGMGGGGGPQAGGRPGGHTGMGWYGTGQGFHGHPPPGGGGQFPTHYPTSFPVRHPGIPGGGGGILPGRTVGGGRRGGRPVPRRPVPPTRFPGRRSGQTPPIFPTRHGVNRPWKGR